MRVTRAQAAAQINIDEAADPTEMATEDIKSAAPIDAHDDDQSQELSMSYNGQPELKRQRGKKASRTASATRAKKVAQQNADEVGLHILEDEPEESQQPERPARSLRKTRSALQQPDSVADTVSTDDNKPEEQAQDIAETSQGVAEPATRSGSPVASPSRVLQPKSPAKQLLAKEKRGMRSTSNKENMSPLTADAPSSPAMNRTIHGRIAETTLPATPEHVQSESPSTLPEESQLVHEDVDPSFPVDHVPAVDLEEAVAAEMTTQDPIEAMDALEEAIQQVDDSLPRIEDIASPQKSANDTPDTASTPLPALKLSPVSKKSPTLLRRSSTIRKSTGTRPQPAQKAADKRTSIVNKRMSQVVGPKSTQNANKDILDSKDTKTENQAPVIPHSKPRPISLSFPTPPKPPKSKPAALPTFKLPGEAIAAKLKAAKEARMKKEEEAPTKKPAFKARPAPKVKEVTAVVRQTNASRARESLMSKSVNGLPPAAAPSTTLRRTTTVRESTNSRPSMSANKRLSMAPTRTTPATVAPKPRPQSMIITSRPSQLSSKPRPSLSSKPIQPRTTLAPAAGKSTSSTAKGREVFQRAAIEKAETEKARKEKEDAAKKARAEAAERGRIASREWAEKQKKRMNGLAQKKTAAVVPTA